MISVGVRVRVRCSNPLEPARDSLTSASEGVTEGIALGRRDGRNDNVIGFALHRTFGTLV